MKLEEKIEIKMPVVVLHECDSSIFESSCKTLVDSGYKLSSTYCGFVNDSEYDYCESLHAIFVIGKPNA